MTLEILTDQQPIGLARSKVGSYRKLTEIIIFCVRFLNFHFLLKTLIKLQSNVLKAQCACC